MGKRKQVEYIQGHATHRRTEGDSMSVLLDAVTLDADAAWSLVRCRRRRAATRRRETGWRNTL